MKVAAFHTTEPETPEVYHNNGECDKGASIKPEHVAKGTDGRRLCSFCKELNK